MYFYYYGMGESAVEAHGFNEPPANASSFDILKLAATGSKFPLYRVWQGRLGCAAVIRIYFPIIGMNSKRIGVWCSRYGACCIGGGRIRFKNGFISTRSFAYMPYNKRI